MSTDAQDLEHQEHDLHQELARRGWRLAGVYRETASGAASSRRPELARLRHDAALRRFNVVLVWSLSRLGRSTLEVLNLVQELDTRGIRLASLREPHLDTTTPTGRYLTTTLAAVAELEREWIRERTKSGLAGARRRGKRLGRPPKVTADQVRYLFDLNRNDRRRGATTRTAKALGITPQHVRRLLKATNPHKNGPTPRPA